MTEEETRKREELFARWRAKFRANRERLEKLAAEGDEKARRILAEAGHLPPPRSFVETERDPGEEG